MGKGGEKVTEKKSNRLYSSRAKKLERLSTDDLKNWALAYGEKVGDREALIDTLVSISEL